MPHLLPAIISNSSRPHQPFVLVQSAVTASCLPVLREIIAQHDPKNGSLLLFCFLHQPAALVDDPALLDSGTLQVFDRTGYVPGYDDAPSDPCDFILETVKNAPRGPLSVLVDSADTLCADLASPSEMHALVAALLAHMNTRPPPSRLILHIHTPSPLLPLLLPTRLSPTLAHITAHPPALLAHLSTAALTPPPPRTPRPRFWRAFAPLAARAWEVERLVFGASGPGGPAPDGEIVLEVLLRARGAERVLEGWGARGPCALEALESLRGAWGRVGELQAAADPMRDVSFNLALTPEQQQSRAQVPLPYAHEGKAPEAQVESARGTILYDPDSADDIDDEDPDEDLDI